MPSNQQRREAAKRKLQRQLVRREERERERRRRMIIVGAIAAVLVIAGGIWFATSRGGTDTASSDTSSATGTDSTDSTGSSGPSTPCTYTVGGKAAKDVRPPSNTSPANTGTIDVDMTLNGTKFTATLDRKAAPCTVNSFLSLASQGFYDNTDCHRLTKSANLNILQCGDPTGKGNGGPGYTFDNENTENTAYPVGTLAMANSGTDSTTGAGTNGSQFFIVYGNTKPSGSYTVFGKVSAEGMKAVDAIAAKGVTDGAQSGKPVAAAKIDSVTVPADAVAATGDWATSSAAATDTAAATDGATDTGGPTGSDQATDTATVTAGATDTAQATTTEEPTTGSSAP